MRTVSFAVVAGLRGSGLAYVGLWPIDILRCRTNLVAIGAKRT